jgi:cell division septation protein DedD
MAGSGSRKPRGGDWTMGGRHLMAAFVIVVLLCGVFFALGYVMGQTAESAQPLLVFKDHKANATAAASGAAKPAGDTPGAPDLDFYSLRDPGKNPAELSAPAARHAEPAPAARPVSVPVRSTARPGSFRPPVMPRGALVLQVAALRHEADALALANLLQQKNYPAFVLPNGSAKLFRVQVGPYKNTRSAELARRGLEREGFKTILKR